MDIVYGRNPVLEALRSGRGVRKLVIAEGLPKEDRLEQILAIAHERDIAVEMSSRRRIEDIAHSEHHQGVAGYFHTRAPFTLDDLLDAAKSPQLFLVLDEIQDPQNLGAILRTADATGVDGLVVPKRRAASLTPAVAKVSAGASEYVKIAYVPNLVQALDRLRERGVWCIGFAGEAGDRYDQVDFTQPLALVIGAEGSGLRPITRDHCDRLVKLPMLGAVSSLNAATTGAIALYEVLRQRGFAER